MKTLEELKQEMEAAWDAYAAAQVADYAAWDAWDDAQDAYNKRLKGI